jgi:hypothetical protein
MVLAGLRSGFAAVDRTKFCGGELVALGIAGGVNPIQGKTVCLPAGDVVPDIRKATTVL